jgi:hypothetical protein
MCKNLGFGLSVWADAFEIKLQGSGLNVVGESIFGLDFLGYLERPAGPPSPAFQPTNFLLLYKQYH